MAKEELMRLSDVPRYMRINHSTDVTRQTVYNWVKTGVKGVKLQAVPGLTRRQTRKDWVDAFVQHLMAVRTIGTD